MSDPYTTAHWLALALLFILIPWAWSLLGWWGLRRMRRRGREWRGPSGNWYGLDGFYWTPVYIVLGPVVLFISFDIPDDEIR